MQQIPWIFLSFRNYSHSFVINSAHIKSDFSLSLRSIKAISLSDKDLLTVTCSVTQWLVSAHLLRFVCWPCPLACWIYVDTYLRSSVNANHNRVSTVTENITLKYWLISTSVHYIKATTYNLKNKGPMALFDFAFDNCSHTLCPVTFCSHSKAKVYEILYFIVYQHGKELSRYKVRTIEDYLLINLFQHTAHGKDWTQVRRL